VRRLLKFAADGIPVHYVTGNHDSAMRRYAPLGLGSINLVDRLELVLDGRRHWFLHGDAFDLALGTPRLISGVGTIAYDAVCALGVGLNRMRSWIGLRPVSLAAACKRSVPAARRHIARFEDICLRSAAARGYDAVVAGHIHVPCQRSAVVEGRAVTYLNSGDWVDSLSALEYVDGAWRIVTWAELAAAGQVPVPHLEDSVAILPAAARCA